MEQSWHEPRAEMSSYTYLFCQRVLLTYLNALVHNLQYVLGVTYDTVYILDFSYPGRIGSIISVFCRLSLRMVSSEISRFLLYELKPQIMTSALFLQD